MKVSIWMACVAAAAIAMAALPAVAGDPITDTEKAFGRNTGVAVKGIRLGRHPDKLRLVLDATGPVNFDYWISERGRTIVVLIPQVKWSAADSVRPGKDSPIYRIRFFPNATGGGVLSILGREALGLSAIEQLGPDRKRPHRVVFDIPSREQDAWMPAGGIMRDGRLLPSHDKWPPAQQAAAGGALPVITRPSGARTAPEAQPAGATPPETREGAPPKPMSRLHLGYATGR